MKIEQEKMKFKPISIIFENRFEALQFIGLIDRLENVSRRFTHEQNRMITQISNAFTNMEVQA